MKCSFCGHEFDENISRTGCAGCPMSKGCSKIKCPICNYEMLPEPGWIKGLTGIFKAKGKKKIR